MTVTRDRDRDASHAQAREAGHGHGHDGLRRATVAAVAVVAVVAAVVSYEHMRHLAQSVGEGWRSWLLPLSVDGLMVAASMVLLTRARTGARTRWAGLVAWCALGLGAAASVAANVASARPGVVPALVAGFAPLALLLAVELLLAQGRAARTTAEAPGGPVRAPVPAQDPESPARTDPRAGARPELRAVGGGARTRPSAAGARTCTARGCGTCAQVRAARADGHTSTRAVARALGLPESTARAHVRRVDLEERAPARTEEARDG